MPLKRPTTGEEKYIVHKFFTDFIKSLHIDTIDYNYLINTILQENRNEQENRED